MIDADVAAALAEDIGSGDVTADLLPDAPESAYLLCKEDCVVAGRPWFDAVHRALDPDVRIEWRCNEGDRIAKGTVIATLQGHARALVTAERSALNFLQTLSGTATTTAQYVDAAHGTGARILDTRKTIPGLRLAQKYAVRIGGGDNHRIGLYDAVMLKENHIRVAGSVTAAISQARAKHPDLPLIVEVETLDPHAARAHHPDALAFRRRALRQQAHPATDGANRHAIALPHRHVGEVHAGVDLDGGTIARHPCRLGDGLDVSCRPHA